MTLAEVAELADAHDSNSCSFGSVGSIPTFGISSTTALNHADYILALGQGNQ